MFALGDPPDYEPDAGRQRRPPRPAARAGAPAELVYDLLLGDDGRALLYSPDPQLPDGNLDAVREMLAHPNTVPGLGDGGAHVGTICDASFPTTLLTHWCRDRTRGRAARPAVRRAAASAGRRPRTVGLLDRGVLAPGYRADVNVIDFDAPAPRTRPASATTCPPAASACCSDADGYLHTFVAGDEVYADGEPTGALPGRLVRGAQPAPE